MRFVLFGCIRDCWAELVQKFVPRSRVGIFRHEHTRSSPLDPKLTFCAFILFGCIWDRLVALRNSVQNEPSLCKMFVPRSRVGIFRNRCTRSTPLDPKLMFWYVSYYLVAFGTVWLPYETRCKTGRASSIVRDTKSRRNFSQRTHPIHPVGP